MEGKEWVWDNGIIKEVEINEIQKEIMKAKRAELDEKKAAVFNKFLKNL